MSTNKALWGLSLDTTCPRCKTDFDMLDHDSDIFEYVDVCESDTNMTKGYSVYCPNCDYEFSVDFEW